MRAIRSCSRPPYTRWGILSRADLNGGANFSAATLSGAILSDADLSGATDFIQEQLDQACGKGAKLALDSKLRFKKKALPPKPANK